ncbi:Lrp/AsnC family transcriptional regulator [Candidatus Micrarchaeota archaeon]|nr:Lrp/AsnC family transcriptional regulator [Candidatus Micrarchaeota archaeon]
MSKKTQEIDEMDARIMRELIADSGRSYRNIAKQIGLSPAALVERIKSLERKDFITGYGARVNYLKLGFEFMAIVEISMSGKNLIAIEEKVAKLPHVAAVWDTTGEYDALAVLMCKTRGELSATVKRILATEGVRKTNTNMVLNVVSRLTEFGEV